MRFYENPEKTSENRLKPRAYYIPENAGACISLNGIWRFRYYERDFDLEEQIAQWDEIDVPSCWQSRGYENPNYPNVRYPFPVDPPYVPDANPCGVPVVRAEKGMQPVLLEQYRLQEKEIRFAFRMEI